MALLSMSSNVCIHFSGQSSSCVSVHVLGRKPSWCLVKNLFSFMCVIDYISLINDSSNLPRTNMRLTEW